MNLLLVILLIPFIFVVIIYFSKKPTTYSFLSSPSKLKLAGSGDYDFEMVGESHYQDALENICGGKCEQGAEWECEALLQAEPRNKYDENAIAVLIDGDKVGYLAREDAVDFKNFFASQGVTTVKCDAKIVGGWKRETSEGSFGVKLDIDYPIELEAI